MHFTIIGKNNSVRGTSLIRAAKKHGDYTFYAISDITFTDKGIFHKNKPLEAANTDMVIFTAPRFKENMRILDAENEMYFLIDHFRKAGIPTLNMHAFLTMPFQNKLSQMYVFSKEDIPTIPTAHILSNSLEKISETISTLTSRFPVIIKKADEDNGRGVYRLEKMSDLATVLEEKIHHNLLIQPFIENDGDYRVIVLGHKVIDIVKRSAKKGSWKNNIAQGGTLEKFSEKGMVKFTEGVSKKLNIDFAGIDIIKDGNKYLVMEINYTPDFDLHEDLDLGDVIIKHLSKK